MQALFSLLNTPVGASVSLRRAGMAASVLHVGRSSQDILATANAGLNLERLVKILAALSEVRRALWELADREQGAVVPAYTNGVQAQPTLYSHYLLAQISVFGRDVERAFECIRRFDFCPMGSTVLNGTGWPLNRAKMAEVLGFAAPVTNAFDATCESPVDFPVELAQIAASSALHVGSFISDVMVQYAQPRPWILLAEGGENTYVSSAMPQKRNPGLLNNCRADASNVVGELSCVMLRAHNLVPGMVDAKSVAMNTRMLAAAKGMMERFLKVLNGLRINPDRALEELNSARVEKASLEAAVKSGKENTERLNSEKEELISKIARTRAAIPVIERELEELNRQAEHSALTADEQKVVDDIRARIKQTTDNKVALNERIKQIDVERLDLHNNIQSLKDKLNGQQIALTKLDADLENMQQRILEEYGEDYEGCLKYKVEDFDISTAASTASSLKRQITMLGAINPNAVAEYKEVKERYDKMASDKADMEKAIDDLNVALDEIRQEMLRIFNDGFSKINENFKQTFKELFGGGRAELELDYTDCEDPLDAGVEIVACPPGKKLTKISLLSGGERALTAIAILFAIIGMRPMPFCVLDEIEAALDEANVGRYAKYLKKFSSETQFIVITHRKPTMENADNLFGVTMEEKGVSKIVSVKLSEVEQRLGGDTVM